MTDNRKEKIKALINKGVTIPNPDSIEVSDDVNIERISGEGVTIYSGCKLYGSSTLILQNAKLGLEGPVTIDDCQIGPGVDLKGGYFRSAVFLKKANMGLNAQVREGTILEEESSGAHTVGLKQTILFPFVTLGSLINFCDCLMSGGTNRKDHSEVGSSFIHFNFTPNQDKATASLIGDVPRGVMLNQKPIFLGGQGGLVGPCRLEYGTITGAGTITRKDELRPNRLIVEGGGKNINIPFRTGRYPGIKRIIVNNVNYIANLIALMNWYQHVRSQFVSTEFPETLLSSLKSKLDMAIDERIKRLRDLSDKTKTQNAEKFYDKWPEVEDAMGSLRNLENHPFSEYDSIRDRFLEIITQGIKNLGNDYIPVIKALETDDSALGTQWLQGIVDDVSSEIYKVIPHFGS